MLLAIQGNISIVFSEMVGNQITCWFHEAWIVEAAEAWVSFWDTNKIQ